MTDDDAFGALLPGQHSPSFERRVCRISEGTEYGYQPEEWRGALVVVAKGQVELLCHDGSALRFGQGDVLFLDGLPVRAIRARSEGGATLAGISRGPGSVTHGPERTDF